MDLQDFRCLTKIIKSNLPTRQKKNKGKGDDHLCYVVERVEYLHMALELNNTNAFLLFMDHLVSTDFNPSLCFVEKGEAEEAEKAWQELVGKTKPWF